MVPDLAVWVDRRPWRQVTSFAEARAHDEVCVLDPENGCLLDPAGQRITRPHIVDR
jgi:hypothetical protein